MTSTWEDLLRGGFASLDVPIDEETLKLLIKRIGEIYDGGFNYFTTSAKTIGADTIAGEMHVLMIKLFISAHLVR
jgi:hypothetical protein